MTTKVRTLRWTVVCLAVAVLMVGAVGAEAAVECIGCEGGAQVHIAMLGGGVAVFAVEPAADGMPLLEAEDPGSSGTSLAVQSPQGGSATLAVETPEGSNANFSFDDIGTAGSSAAAEPIDGGDAEMKVEGPGGGEAFYSVETPDVGSVIALFESYWAGEAVDLRAFILSLYGL